MSREHYKIGNVLSCMPAGYEIREAWAEQAATHCSRYSEPHFRDCKVIVAMGATPLRHLLGLWGQKGIKVENFHGTVHQLASGQFVVPTYHPSFLQRGAHNLIGVVSFDLQVAHEVARGEYLPAPIDVVIDPPVDWFRVWADHILGLPRPVWLAVDCETPDKATKEENELTQDDRSFQILRVNLAYHPDEGITVPFEGPYIPIIQELVSAAGLTTLWWNAEYDLPRFAKQGIVPGGRVLDGMWLAHVLNSDIPLGLGFWAPFYSRYGAWKHLASTSPAFYAALDGPQTHRTVFGVVADLKAAGQWDIAQRHVEALYWKVLKPAQLVGVPVNREKLDAFIEDLSAKTSKLLGEVQAIVPESDRPLTGGVANSGYTRPPQGLHPHARTTTLKGEQRADAAEMDPLKLELYAHARVVERTVAKEVWCCNLCGAEDVVRAHRCDKKQDRSLTLRSCALQRWFWLEPFNPNSWQQILAYAKAHGHKLVIDRKTKKPTTSRDALREMHRTSKDPLYPKLLDLRAVVKVRGTYGIGVRKLLDADSRFHPTPTFRPSTMRLSYVSPNIQNVVADKGGEAGLAAGFRNVVEAAPGCRIWEFDYAGIEAKISGWCMEDPQYVRLAGLGVHGMLAAHLLDRPADLSWSDADLAAYFAEIKAKHPKAYEPAKRCVHGQNYGMTAHGMVEKFPQWFPTLKAAQKVVDIYHQMAPRLPQWHRALQQRAYEYGYIGGAGQIGWIAGKDGKPTRVDPNAHPYQYKHYFWSVLHYRTLTDKGRIQKEKRGEPVVWLHGRPFAIDWGEDSKRAIAFTPQSTARGVLTEAMLPLLAEPDHPSYIGDAYYGRTPLRAPIHDSLLMEIPIRGEDRIVEAVFREMLRPVEELPLPAAWGMGEYLTIGVEAKAGRDWGKGLEKLPTPSLAAVGLANDLPASPADEGEASADEWAEMGTVA